MKTKILKKINQRVRVIEKNGMFVVQNRNALKAKKDDGEWHDMNQFTTYRKAVERKNGYIVMVVMRDLGYRNEFVRRRVGRKKQ
jgi:hypothetical protein